MKITNIKFSALLCLVSILTACSVKSTRQKTDPHTGPKVSDVKVQTQSFKDYWYAGKAELSHYNLQQIHYGQVHDGTAMTIFVTEDFLTDPQVKLESARNGRDAQTVMKFNFLRNFVTGIYKYHVMTSVFTPVEVNKYPHSLKVANSSQEWCGATYSQINLHDGEYKVHGHTYFEHLVNVDTTLEAVWLENELWTKLRLSPKLLPEGKISIIPNSFSMHGGGWAIHQAVAQKQKWSGSSMPGQNLMSYKVRYPKDGRSLNIIYESKSPYRIAGWIEKKQVSGDTLTARSVRTNTIMEPYWKMNHNKFEPLRKKLGLKQ